MLENEYRIEENIYAKETGVYGKSLFAKRSFKKDELVFVAYGSVTTKPNMYTYPINWDLYIEPRVPEGNLCQYLCHSCEPNLGIRDRTMFVAMHDIKEDEEVTVDYAMFAYENCDVFSPEEWVCKCGKKTCRGKFGLFSELPAEVKEKYKGYISVFLFEDGKKMKF